MQGKKLYVGNLNYQATNDDLQALFAEYGQVESVRVIEKKGFGFVEMSDPSEAEQAKEALNNTLFMGRTIKVDEARPPKKDRRPGGGGQRRGERHHGPRQSGSGQQKGNRDNSYE